MTSPPQPGDGSSPELDDTIDLDGTIDLAREGDRLQLVKEIVAMANASGGVISLPPAEAEAAVDPATITELVGRYVAPDRLQLGVTHQVTQDGAVVVTINVPAFSDPPLVFGEQGWYPGPDGKPVVVFEQHGVYRRRANKTEPASRQDFREWTAAAVAAEHDRWRSRLALLANLAPGGALEVRPAEGGAVEEPGSHLRRAVAQYRDDPAKLLSGRDLLAALVARAGTTFDAAAYELIVQSALRRRPSLFLWLRLAEPEEAWVGARLLDAIVAPDRDKSDAGRSIVDVAALYLDDPSYEAVISGLASSHYAHFRDAARTGAARAAVLDRLNALRSAGPRHAPLGARSDLQLFDEADRLAGMLLSAQHHGQARRLSSVGMELLWRHLRPAPAP